MNAVGVELNTASKQLLAYVSGLGPALATNIVAFRKRMSERPGVQAAMKAEGLERAARPLAGREKLRPGDGLAVVPRLRDRWRARGREMPEVNAKQADVVEGGVPRGHVLVDGVDEGSVQVEDDDGVVEVRALGDVRPRRELGMVRTALSAGHQRLIGFDMGGTSTDVSHYAGEFERAFETQVAGVRMRAPMMSIHTVAAGGGSIGWIDRGGMLQVGPRSAGARPGPACWSPGPHRSSCGRGAAPPPAPRPSRRPSS